MKKTIILVSIMLISTGCLIEEVEQPDTIQAGGIFQTIVTVTDMNAENQNPHPGVLCIMVPHDWSFVSGEYNANGTYFGDMIQDPDSGSVWSTISGQPVLLDTLFNTPVSMKWIYLISDIGYTHPADVWYEATVDLQVGQVNGEFPIGYLVTVNTGDMLMFINDSTVNGEDVDWELAGLDTSMNHWVTVTGGVSVDENKIAPNTFELSQNYPNPFNPSTVITYMIDERVKVDLSVYDITGRLVSKLVDSVMDSGVYETLFTADGLPSGMYFYQLKVGDRTETKKMILLE